MYGDTRRPRPLPLFLCTAIVHRFIGASEERVWIKLNAS
jgi:hypothetical protein